MEILSGFCTFGKCLINEEKFTNTKIHFDSVNKAACLYVWMHVTFLSFTLLLYRERTAMISFHLPLFSFSALNIGAISCQKLYGQERENSYHALKKESDRQADPSI